MTSHRQLVNYEYGLNLLKHKDNPFLSLVLALSNRFLGCLEEECEEHHLAIGEIVYFQSLVLKAGSKKRMAPLNESLFRLLARV